MPVVIITAWFFNNVLIPGYLLARKYGEFFLYAFYALIISLDLELLMVFIAFILIGHYDHENLGRIIDAYKWMPVTMYFIIILSGFFTIVSFLLKRNYIPGREDSNKYIMVRSERKNRKLDLSLVVFVESMADYVKIYLATEETVITREKISSLAEKLPVRFIRVHRSYIINYDFMESYNKEEVFIKGKSIPVSRTYKHEFLAQMKIFMDIC